LSIFASCKDRLNEYGIDVWDRASGEQANFFYKPPGCAGSTSTASCAGSEQGACGRETGCWQARGRETSGSA
jgi:hypothetical protein